MSRASMWLSRYAVLCVALVGIIGGRSPVAGQAPEPQPLAPDVAQAWGKAGAQVGWYGEFPGGSMVFEPGWLKLKDPIPAFKFQFWKWQPGTLTNLPDPGRPFTLHFTKSGLTNAGLKELAGLKSLHTLDLGSNPVTDAGLKELVALKNLRGLVVASPLVTDAGMKEVGRLESLELLSVPHTKVTDAGLKELTGLKSLKTLYLTYTTITDAGLKELAPLKSLRELHLHHTAIRDAGLKHLAALKSLKRLILVNTQVTDQGLHALAGLKLQLLAIPETARTDRALGPYLAALEDPVKLELGSWNLTDAGVKELAGLKSLKVLYLGSGAPLTDACLKVVGKLTSLEEFSTTSNLITDAGLKELTGLKSLKVLFLASSKVTNAGLDELRESLPDCKITNR